MNKKNKYQGPDKFYNEILFWNMKAKHFQAKKTYLFLALA